MKQVVFVQPVRHSFTRWLLLALVCVGCAGCEPQGDRVSAVNLDDPATAYGDNRDHLILALDFLDNFHEYNAGEIVPRIVNHLQTWIGDAQLVDDWAADTLFARLPRRLNLRNDDVVLSRFKFDDFEDIWTLREARWLNEIATQVCRKDVQDPELAAWIQQQESEIGLDGVRDLSCAYLLFDWVVRNIAIEPSEMTEAGVPLAGRLSWEALLIGRGDPLVRARLFILLCRQARIPAIMIGLDRDDESPLPWVAATWIGGRLYLFDLRLGLPIPTADGEGIATLAQVQTSPELLRELDTDGQAYPVEGSQLNQLIGMLDGSIPYLSQRMRIVEDALPNNQRMVLSTAPSALAAELRKATDLAGFELWSLHYDTLQHRRKLREEQGAGYDKLQRELALFLEDTPLAAARRQHFRGQYADDPPELGAKALYIQCRIPNAQIDRMNAEELAQIYALQRGAAVTIDERFVAAAKAKARITKQYASYWLGIISFEENHPKVAIDYFRKRVLDAFPRGIWDEAARYQLARSLERLGKANGDPQMIDEAIELYEATDSPQAVGNRLRAQRLKTD